MENKSIWQNKKVKLKKQENSDNFKTDILIIGGGITGVTTAYFLMDEKKKVTLIDKGFLGEGVTAKTTGKLNYLQGLIYQKIEDSFDLKVSKLYLDSQIEAIEIVNNIVMKHDIDCDLEKVDSFIFTKEKGNIDKIKREKYILEEFGKKGEIVNQLPIHFPIEYGFFVSDTYIFHPLKYLNKLVDEIKKKVSIYESVMALEITPNDRGFLVTTDKNVIEAKKVVVACHYPFFIKPGFIPLRTYIKREYVNASKYDCSSSFTAISVDSKLHSIRFWKDYLIYGSNEQRLTSKIDYSKQFDKSKRDYKRLFSKEPEFSWINQDIMVNDELPLVGVVDTKQPGLLIATGFQAWGMTNATIAAKLISDIIMRRKNKYIDLFSPKRFNKKMLVQSIIGGMHYSKAYLQTTVKKNVLSNRDDVYTVKVNGSYYGVFLDNYKKRHIVKLLCPHMRCHLVFNDSDKTWDCPCHGSRFNIDGDVIEGPANYSIRLKDDDSEI